METRKPNDAHYAVNGEALRAELRKRGLALEPTSRKLGYNKGFLSKAIVEGRIAVPAALLIEHMLGIPYDAYKPKEKEPEPKIDPMVTEVKILAAKVECLQKAMQEMRTETEKLIQACNVIVGVWK